LDQELEGTFAGTGAPEELVARVVRIIDRGIISVHDNIAGGVKTKDVP
jgi:hypothetical protein